MTYTPLELAQVFIKTGELADALAALAQHLEDHPDDDNARRLRIEAQLRLPDHLSAALADLNRLTAPTADDWVKRSVIHERLGDLTAAYHHLRHACALDPHSERWIERELYLLQAMGQPEQAIDRLSRLPLTWRWQQWRGDLLLQVGRWEAAIDSYTDAIDQINADTALCAHSFSHSLRGGIYLNRAEAYYRQGRSETALADYNAAAELIPDEPFISFRVGLMRANRGDLEAARLMCTDAMRRATPLLQAQFREELARYPDLLASVQ